MRHRETRRVTLKDQTVDRYPRFGFELPNGITSFEVSLVVDGDAVLDLGCEGPNGWRGWSGGARRRFTVAENDATPGYLPGAVHPGTWYVVLGLHSLTGTGATVTVTVDMPAVLAADHGPVEAPVERHARGSDRELPAPEGLRWYAGDMHAHSLHSDGALSLWQLANQGVLSGLDFLCVTDHNTVSHHAHLPSVGQRHGIVLVPGQEVTTHQGHANVFGEIGFVDFREPAANWVAAAAERGGVMSINHPVSGDCSWLFDLPTKPAAVELYHGSWYEEPISTAALAWHRNWDRDATLIGGGDFHDRGTPLRPGMPTTWIAAEDCTPEALIEGLRDGRTTITATCVGTEDGARPVLSDCPILVREGDRLWAIGARGLVLVSGTGRRQGVDEDQVILAAPRQHGPFRLEQADRRVIALCR